MTLRALTRFAVPTLALALAGVSASACVQPPVPMTLGDSATFLLIDMKRVEYRLDTTSTNLINTLVVRYYSKETDPRRMRDEAVRVSGYLAPVADSIGCTVLLVEPSWHVSVLHMPVRIASRTMQVERRAFEQWEVTHAW